MLLDAQAYACGSSCTIDGPCHDSSEAPTPANITKPPTHLRKTFREEQHPEVNDPSLPYIMSLETQSSSAAAAGAAGGDGATAISNSVAVHNSGQQGCHEEHSQTEVEDLQQQKQKWQQEQPCSPFSSDSCSGSSLHFCANGLGCAGCLSCSLTGSMDCSEDGSGQSCCRGPDQYTCRADSSEKRLVSQSMLVADAAAAAALFPSETGAFLYEPSLF